MNVRTAIVLDRHPLWLDAVEDVLHRLGVEVLAKATRAEEALVLLGDLQPDLLVVDPRAPESERDDPAVIGEALARHAPLKVVVLSSSADAADVDAAFEAGASAYVFKTARPEDVAVAIRQAFEASMFLARPAAAGKAEPPTPAPLPLPRDGDETGLTRREAEVLKLVAEGASNADVARVLWVTEQTVKFHLSNIYRKVGAANRTEASRWAQLHGLLSETAVGDEPRV